MNSNKNHSTTNMNHDHSTTNMNHDHSTCNNQIHQAFIILAAGNSTRFPGNKLQTPLAGLPLIEHTINLASHFVESQHIYVVSQQPLLQSTKTYPIVQSTITTQQSQQPLPQFTKTYPIAQSQSTITTQQPQQSFQTILQSIPNGTGGALIAALQQQSHIYQNTTVLLADTPLITISTIQSLLQSSNTTNPTSPTNPISTTNPTLSTNPTSPHSSIFPHSPTSSTNPTSPHSTTSPHSSTSPHSTTSSTNPIPSMHSATAAIMHTSGTYGRLTLQNNIITDTLEHRYNSFDPNIPGWSWAGAINFHIPSDQLLQHLLTLQPKNNEIQLTDLFTKLPVHTITISTQEGIGINTYEDFILASQYFTLNLLKQHKIIVSNPNSLYISANSTLEDGCTLSNNIHIHNSHIKSTANILPFTYIENSTIEGTVGPFACIKNNSHIHPNAQVGSFVDIKNSTLATNVKVKHLSYIGDCIIDQNTNIGAGTITCNYNKTQNTKSITTIGQNCDIGSNCSLIAPVTIEDNAQIGAGSVITKTVPSNKLAVSRSPQKLYRKPHST